MNLSSDRSIGGFFGLECPLRIRSYHDGAFAVNSARNAFRLILLKTRPRTVHLPGYLCSSMRAPLDDLGFQFETYAINERLEPATAVNVGHNDLVLAVNYFGLKATGGWWSHIRESSSLMIDNSQAFFSPPPSRGFAIYSARKFFGVPDGAYLHSQPPHEFGSLDIGESRHRFAHLLGRIECGPESFYITKVEAERSLAEEPPKRMSRLTRALLSGVNFEEVSRIRRSNFMALESFLGRFNLLNLSLEDDMVPMIYPFLPDGDGLHPHLIKNRIYAARYWPETVSKPLPGSFERRLVKDMVALPVDQRYGIDEMQKVSSFVLSWLGVS